MSGEQQSGRYTFEGEASRRFEEITTRLETLAARMETSYVRFDLFEADKQLREAERSQLTGRIEKLESRNEWIVRAVGGIIIAAVLALVITVTRGQAGV